MRKTLLLVVLLAGCDKANPVAPTEEVRDEVVQVMMPVAKVHNLPVSDTNGDIWYVCATQPRQYVGEVSTWEVDYYIQREECPARPID